MFLFLFCMSVLTPVSIAVVGMVLQKHPVRDINSWSGYRTARSMKSQEAWDFAQKYSAEIWTKGGVVLAVVSAAVMLGFRKGDYEAVSVRLVAVQVICMCISIVPVEIKLWRRF